MSWDRVPRIKVAWLGSDFPGHLQSLVAKMDAAGCSVDSDTWLIRPGESLLERLLSAGLNAADYLLIGTAESTNLRVEVCCQVPPPVLAALGRITRVVFLSGATEEAIQLEVDDGSKVAEGASSASTAAELLGKLESMSFSLQSASYPLKNGDSPATTLTISEIEELILAPSCAWLLQSDDPVLRPEAVFGEAFEAGLDRAAIVDAIDLLVSAGYARQAQCKERGPECWGCPYRITALGFHEYCLRNIPHYAQLLERSLSAIWDHGCSSSVDLALELDIPQRLSAHLIAYFEAHGLLRVIQLANGIRIVKEAIGDRPTSVPPPPY